MKFIKCFVPLLLFFALPILSTAQVLGEPAQNHFVIPLSDQLDAPYGFAKVYVFNYSTSMKEQVTLGTGGVKNITVTQVGRLINVTLGNGNPDRDLEWTQTNDYSMITNPLVIDFSNTPAASLIGFGGDQFFSCFAAGASVDQIGVAAIGEPLSSRKQTHAINFYQDANYDGWPNTGTNSIFAFSFSYTYPNPSLSQ